MVQNKDIEESSLAKMTNGECSKTNGVHNDSEAHDESEEEDDYLDYLLMVPSLDKSVENRNMSLISESLMSFFAAIEGRKEYQKIKEELMDNYVVPSVIKAENKIQETIVEEPKETIENELNESVDIKNEVTTNDDNNEDHETEEIPDIKKHCVLKMWKSTIVPEVELNMYDQFFVCRRCKIFFKTRKFRKMHNVINHRRKKKEEEIVEVVKKPKRVRIRGTRKEPSICDLCSKSFKIKALLRSHMNCHLSEKLHQCTQCNYASKRFNDLKKHNDVHHNPDRVIEKRPRKRRCRECQEIFADKLALRAHKRLSHRKVVERKLKIFKTCEKCEEVLYSKKSFIVHMKEKHPDTMAIKCERCNRKFKTNFRLKKHKSRYEFAGKDCRIKVRQVGEFVCQQCDTKFNLKSHLSLHMRKHQTHTCEQCKIEFKTQLSLKYHEFSHLEIEPKCLHCEKIFTSEQKFANHLKRKSCMLNGLTNGHAPEILIA